MSDIYGFMKHQRQLPKKRPVEERIQDYNDIYDKTQDQLVRDQSGRCMDCGTPFCHKGCPLGNIIPDFNDAVHQEDWYEAYQILSSTNNFPEFTGRICPAPCEAACVLGINRDPVTIEYIEKSIIEKAFEKNWVKPFTPAKRLKTKVAVVGSGPAGLAAADQLNKAGHHVTVFERNEKPGGLLRFGIPDFKLEKWVVDRRIQTMKESGIIFKVNANVGENISVDNLMDRFDGILLAGGSTIPRDLKIRGRQLEGIYFAMEYLEQRNKLNYGKQYDESIRIYAKDKHVVVIGGGDTGSDCVGTANREMAKSITQIELLMKPPLSRSEQTPWPQWPMELRNSSSHEEGCERQWAIMTKEFIGDRNHHLKALKIVDIEWKTDPKSGRSTFVELENSERTIPCDLALLAVGFLHPQHKGLLTSLGVDLDERGNVATVNYQTSIPKVFSAGDMRRGQSLVVWAISEGREAAVSIDGYLQDGKKSSLLSKDLSPLAV